MRVPGPLLPHLPVLTPLPCPCPAAMIQQPRAPPTGQRQAVEVHIKWREVLDYKRDLLRMMSIGTGWSVEKLDQVGGGWKPSGGGPWSRGISHYVCMAPCPGIALIMALAWLPVLGSL